MPTSLLAFFGARVAGVMLHELAHAASARALGLHAIVRLGRWPLLCGSSTSVPAASLSAAALIRHAGWVFSLLLAGAATMAWLAGLAAAPLLAALWTVALDAISSDAMGWVPATTQSASAATTFFCGNFGLLLLEAQHSKRAKEILAKMIRVTMMRGAQSAGIASYRSVGTQLLGSRFRVVNGKRTDLCDKLMKKCGNLLAPASIRAPQFFQGHTRFATTSIAALPGCHPHQWVPRRQASVWSEQPSGQWLLDPAASLETFITHNGDLDFFEVHGVVYPLGDLQKLLAALLHAPCTADVDSMCVAGLLDLLRTAGMWHASARHGYLYGGLKDEGNLASQLPRMWSAATLAAVAESFEATWCEVLVKRNLWRDGKVVAPRVATDVEAASDVRSAMLEAMLSGKGRDRLNATPHGLQDDALTAFVGAAIDAFFYQDLVTAARQLLGGAVGSFGLCLSCSIDGSRELIIGARGQTMSIAFYPLIGAIAWGSESAATKAGMDFSKLPEGVSDPAGLLEGFRLDLDDLNGELVRLSWGDEPLGDAPAKTTAGLADDPYALTVAYAHTWCAASRGAEIMRYGERGRVWASSFIDGQSSGRRVIGRLLRLGRDNPLVAPIPALGVPDPVGKDIADIPSVLRKIQEDWARPSESLNRLTAFTFFKLLRKRIEDHHSHLHDGSVDVLLTGCEVSLWIAEQFASDLHNAFPKLKIVCLSANKLLAQLGQAFPIPNTGFAFNEDSYDFTNTLGLLISHSGGTFGTLNVANLLKGFTPHLFVVSSEWDTQVARAVRGGKAGNAGPDGIHGVRSYVFTTFCGCRPAEPVSLTAAATHQVLTQLLLYVMYCSKVYLSHLANPCGAKFAIEAVRELEGLNHGTLGVVEVIVGEPPRSGSKKLAQSTIRAELLRQGDRWAAHILEGPIAWVLSALYILVTVTAGYTPVSLVAAGITFGATGVWTIPAAAKYPIGVVDSAIYMFLPWWTTVLLRLVQGRPWLHRVAGRSLLIGDIPWVAQSLEAFVSKCFALSYSISTVSVSSGNPADHLVHRHTHRVVRGALLAVGRPDGRLNALTASEAACCLSVSQASSIQNFGVTCESFTLGHNPHKLGLSQNAAFLPTSRKPFISEYSLELAAARRREKLEAGMSVSTVMGRLSNIDVDIFDGLRLPPSPPLDPTRPFESIPPLVDDLPADKTALEPFVGAWMSNDDELCKLPVSQLMVRQSSLQELYEGRVASLERFIGFLVLFHRMAKRVEEWWSAFSLGFFTYDLSRSHSIMRIATTASPVSGAEVRQKMLEIAHETRRNEAIIKLQRRMRKRLYALASEHITSILAKRVASSARLMNPSSSASTSISTSEAHGKYSRDSDEEVRSNPRNSADLEEVSPKLNRRYSGNI